MTDPLVLIHGLGLTQALWDPYVAPLRAAGLKVLTYDLPGHGAAAPLDQDLSLDILADQLLDFLDEHEVAKAHLVGFSLGGMINRKVALKARARVASLTIWNSPHDRGEAQQAAVEARAKASSGLGPGATLEAALQRWLTDQADPALRETIRAWRRGCHGRSYAQTAWVLAHGVRELTAGPHPVGLPTLIMTCEHDVGSTPAMAQAIARDLRAPAPQLVPGLRHLGLLERPEAFLGPLLAFVQDL